MNRLRGISLFELLIVVALTMVVAMASAAVLIPVLQAEGRFRERDRDATRIARLNGDLERWLQSAILPTDGRRGWFRATSSDGNHVDTVSFTALTPPVDLSVMLDDAEEEFEAANQQFGVRGGISELQIGPVAVGAHASGEGLFLRIQTPPDDDPDLGGQERLLFSGAVSLRFEFFDGVEWLEEWDTDTMATPSLPRAVRVYWWLEDEATDAHVVTVHLPNSLPASSQQSSTVTP